MRLSTTGTSAAFVGCLLLLAVHTLHLLVFRCPYSWERCMSVMWIVRYLTLKALQLDERAWLRVSIAHASIVWLTVDYQGYVSLRLFGDSGHIPATKVTYWKSFSRPAPICSSLFTLQLSLCRNRFSSRTALIEQHTSIRFREDAVSGMSKRIPCTGYRDQKREVCLRKTQQVALPIVLIRIGSVHWAFRPKKRLSRGNCYGSRSEYWGRCTSHWVL